jgi:hypothetical protein
MRSLPGTSAQGPETAPDPYICWLVLFPKRKRCCGTTMRMSEPDRAGGSVSECLGHWPGSDDAGRGCIRKRHVTMPSEIVARLRRPASNSGCSTGSQRALLAIIYCHDIASKRPRSDSSRFGCSSLMDLRYGTGCSARPWSSGASPGDEWTMGAAKSWCLGAGGRESCRGWVMTTRATASMIWSRK